MAPHHVMQAIMGEGLAQGPYVAAKAVILFSSKLLMSAFSVSKQTAYNLFPTKFS